MHKIKAKKRFGQNFLHDDSVIQHIIDVVKPIDTDIIIEIGPGLGALTKQLVASGAIVHAIELDRDLLPILRLEFLNKNNFILHAEDALKFDFTKISNLYPDKPIRIIGNLPYNISSALIFKLLQLEIHISDMYFMLQKEMVERLVAKPNNKSYGRLTVTSSYFANCNLMFYVYPYSFTPVPAVDSAIIQIIPFIRTNKALDFKTFEYVVRNAFNMRRKTMRNNLKIYLKNNVILEDIKSIIDLNKRPENIPIDEYIHLSNIIYKYNAT